MTPPLWETPLAERMRPRTLEEYQGHRSILAPGQPLRRMLEQGIVPSCVLYGPPGVGKTALVRLMASVTQRQLFEINAVTAKVTELRDMVDQARQFKDLSGGRSAVAFVDEIYHFNKSQQNALLPWVERGDIILVGTTTENPWFEINKTLLSRLLVFQIQPLERADLLAILRSALTDAERGLGSLNLTCDDAVLEALADSAGGDGRQALTRLEFLARSVSLTGRQTIERADLQSLPLSSIRHDRASDDHYAVISAFIKSIRGSDPDAAVYWLARLLSAGEDPRFVARRMVIAAAEDIGLADPLALCVAASAAYCADMVGMPEARIILSEAVIYLASAPKSNSAYLAVDAAQAAIAKGDLMEVPSHLINGRPGYIYPHDDPRHWVPQAYLAQSRRFYDPAWTGSEPQLRQRLARFWRRFREAPPKHQDPEN